MSSFPMSFFHYLSLRANGVVIPSGLRGPTSHKNDGPEIRGDGVSGYEVDEKDAIRCISMETQLTRYPDDETGTSFGRRVFHPIRFSKHPDRTTPLLFRALVGFQELDGEFRIYKPSPNFKWQHFFTVAFRGGRIQSQDLHARNEGRGLPIEGPNGTVLWASTNVPMIEIITLTVEHIEWTHVVGNVTCAETEEFFRPDPSERAQEVGVFDPLDMVRGLLR